MRVTTREHEVNDQALGALAEREANLFERAGVLVHVVRPGGVDRSGSAVVRPIQEARMNELLARHCAFVVPKKTKAGVETRPVHPPRWCARALLARGSWPELPALEGVEECPVLRADGTVLQSEDVPVDHPLPRTLFVADEVLTCRMNRISAA